MLLKAPREALIHPKLLAREYPAWASDKQLVGLESDQKVALLLLVERSKPDSRWQPFFSMLPKAAIPTMGLTEDDTERLHATVAQFTFNNAVQEIQMRADQLCQFAQNKLPETVAGAKTADIFTKDACRWAYSMVKSRSWSLDVHGDDEASDTAMVPCLDLINHHHEGDILTIDDGATPGSKEVIMRAKREYSAGDQVFIKYGHYAMESAFAIYGFASPEMPLWMIFNTDSDTNEFGTSMATTIGCDKLHASESTGVGNEYLEKLITCHRMVQITEKEYLEADGEGVEKWLEPFDDAIEIAALGQLARSISFHLSAHTEREEPSPQQRMAMEPPQALIASLLQSEKEWLQRSLAEVKLRWAKHLRRRDLTRQGFDPDAQDDTDDAAKDEV